MKTTKPTNAQLTTMLEGERALSYLRFTKLLTEEGKKYPVDSDEFKAITSVWQQLDKLNMTNSTKLNSINTIHPYLWHGQWVFDDPAAGLDKEALVAGMPEMIERLCTEQKIPNYREGFILLFSKDPFPGVKVVLERQEEDSGGNWYKWPETGMRGWTCPALFCYFSTAPDRLYIDVKEAK